jgi:hypothetical protein
VYLLSIDSIRKILFGKSLRLHLHTPVPNQRAPGQKLISVPMFESFIKAIDRALRPLGYSDRSSFIRDAISEKLAADGIKIPVDLSTAPGRSGKGGRPSAVPGKRKQVKIDTNAWDMNDAGNKANAGAKQNPAFSENAINLMPDPDLDPKIKSAADALEALAMERAVKKVKRMKAKP